MPRRRVELRRKMKRKMMMTTGMSSHNVQHSLTIYPLTSWVQVPVGARQNTFMWGGLPADMRCIGGSTHTCGYSLFARARSSFTNNCWKSPYDPKGVGATVNPIN